MCKISNNTRSNSRTNSESEGKSSETTNGNFAHIKSANRKVRLLDILRKNGIKIEQNHQRPTWSNNIICPLPSHKGAKERTPSFGYNFVNDYAHCFGCNFTGRAVEFLSAFKGITRTTVANEILSQYNEDVSIGDFDSYNDEITPVLLEGSKFIQTLIQKYKNDSNMLEYIDKLIWWLDFYIMAKVSEHKIEPNELKYRIEKIKELLSQKITFKD